MRMNGLILIRGGGDLATGVIQKFYRAGCPVLVLESPAPTAIRRGAALCEAVYDGVKTVEDMTARRIPDIRAIEACLSGDEIPLLVDPDGASIAALKPAAVVDAIIAKRNMNTNRRMAPVTIALGPGFTAGADVDAVIETMRGHSLGRLILKGSAMPDTGVPGEILGKSAQRVLRAPCGGVVVHNRKIGDIVKRGEPVLSVEDKAVCAPFRGLLRGLIREGLTVEAGLKIADIDPRTGVDIHTISDKARCLGGAALEAYFYLTNRRWADAAR